MSIPLIARAPNSAELTRLKLILSVFGDGSGQERDAHGTRPGWRDIERAIAVWLEGENPENKDVFDVVVESGTSPGHFAGLSLKSKELRRTGALADLSRAGRVYMELCNSPAKLWAPLHGKGIAESDFKKKKKPNEIGGSLLEIVSSWHTTHKVSFEAANRHTKFDLTESVYVTISYKTNQQTGLRDYQLHSFNLDFPTNVTWQYKSARCLTGFDPAFPTEALFDWYGLSGGQLKYYPRATSSRHHSSRFELVTPPQTALSQRAARYWPDEWTKAGGVARIKADKIADELERLAILSDAKDAKDILEKAAKKIRSI